MGSTFSNISIMINNSNYSEANVCKCINAMMTKKGYVNVSPDTNAEVTFAVAVDPTSNWITFYSDSFSDFNPDELEAYGTQLSKLFKSPSLCTSCYDSDFLLLHLIDATKKLNAHAAIGQPYDDIPLPLVDYYVWEPYLAEEANREAFKRICESEYICAEEALQPLSELLGFHAINLNASYDVLDEIEKIEIAYKFCFALAESNKTKPNNEPVNLQQVFSSLMPAFIEQTSIVSCICGSSRGLAVYFIGPYVEDDSITFSPVELFYHDYKNRNSLTQQVNIPLELKKVQLENGTFAYYAECPEFEIPEKVNSNLKDRKLQDEQFTRMFGVRFVPHGDAKKILDIFVGIVPLQRKTNQVIWNVWCTFGSKEAFIDQHNATWESTRKNNPYVDNVLLNKDDYLA